MHANPPHKGFRIIAIDEQQLEGMDHNQNELNLKQTKNHIQDISYFEIKSYSNSPFGRWSNTSSTTDIFGIVDPWLRTYSRCTLQYVQKH